MKVLPAAIEAVRAPGGLVIAQLNPCMPYTFGDSVLPCDAIDYAIETEVPLPSSPPRSVTEVSVSIADRVTALIGDGATLRLGIGAIPDAGQPVTASFAFGSADLYAWLDRNPDVRMLRPETVNDPAQIARQPLMTSVNGALQVDLFA